MPLIKPESGVLFLKVPLSEPVIATVVGEAHSYQVHWVKTRGRREQLAARCQMSDGKPCAICADAKGWKARYVLPVRVEGELRIVELGKPQWGWLEVQDVMGSWVGTRVRIGRERPAKNAVITITTVGREHVSEELRFDAAGIAATEGQEIYRAWLIDREAEGPVQAVGGSLSEMFGDHGGHQQRRSR